MAKNLINCEKKDNKVLSNMFCLSFPNFKDLEVKNAEYTRKKVVLICKRAFFIGVIIIHISGMSDCWLLWLFGSLP